jgi:hypothetical protein
MKAIKHKGKYLPPLIISGLQMILTDERVAFQATSAVEIVWVAFKWRRATKRAEGRLAFCVIEEQIPAETCWAAWAEACLGMSRHSTVGLSYCSTGCYVATLNSWYLKCVSATMWQPRWNYSSSEDLFVTQQPEASLSLSLSLSRSFAV